MTARGRQIVLAARPKGKPELTDFRLEDTAVPTPVSGQLLLEMQDLSLDPYMRGRMNDGKSYATPLQIGDVMTGETVAQVLVSNHDPEALARAAEARQQGARLRDMRHSFVSTRSLTLKGVAMSSWLRQPPHQRRADVALALQFAQKPALFEVAERSVPSRIAEASAHVDRAGRAGVVLIAFSNDRRGA